MHESWTYQELLDEGRLAEAKRIVLRLGSARLGPPDERAREALDALSDPDRAEAVADRLLVATSWDDLLSGQQPGQAAR